MPERPASLPLHPVSRTHLAALTTEIGILQHAVGSLPDPAHGYCVDDVARAIQVDLLHARSLGSAAVADSLRRGLQFLRGAARGPGARMRNFRRFDGTWLPGPGSEDSQARALLALGETIAFDPPASARVDALELWQRTLPIVRRPSAMRATASVILASAAVLRVRDDPLAAATLQELATRLHGRLRDTSPAWPWPEPIVTYENALLPRALIVAGARLGAAAMLDAGLALLDWLVAAQTAPAGHLSPIGNGWWPRDGKRSRFDQQPIEATALLLAAEAALDATGDARHRETMEAAYGWFLGQNDTGVRLADPARGACRDGLSEHGMNTNEGAESTLMWLMAVEHIRSLRGVADARPAPTGWVDPGDPPARAGRPMAASPA